MKNVLVALLLLCLVIGFAVANALYLDAKIGLLLDLGGRDRFAEALEKFLIAEPFLALTVHEADLLAVESALREALAYSKTNPAAYQAAKERFFTCLRDIRAKEKFSLSNVF